MSQYLMRAMISGLFIILENQYRSGELHKRIKEAFDREGIETPFPKRVTYQIKLPDAEKKD